MNFLFIVPRTMGYAVYPTGVAYVAASLKAHGYNTFGLNLFYEDDIDTAIKKKVGSCNIDVVCMGGLSREYSKIEEIVLSLRKIEKRVVIIIGGGLLSTEPELIMENIDIDIGVIGEGEVTICELADALKNKTDLNIINGIIFRDSIINISTPALLNNGKLIKTQARKEMLNIDDIPYPDYELLGFGTDPASIVSLAIVASRSCPYSCTFCYHPSGTKYRQRSLDSIFNEIDYWVKKYVNLKEIGLYDELFARDKKRLMGFCKRMKTYENLICSGLQLRVDDVDEEIIAQLKDIGVREISYGLESADNNILKSMNKHITIEQIEKALEITHRAGILIQGNFIFGDVEETMETASNTISWWLKHPQYRINLGPIQTFPGTKLYEHAVKNGIISNKVQFLQGMCPTVNVSKLSESEFERLLETLTALVGLHETVPTERIYSYTPDGKISLSYKCGVCGGSMLVDGFNIIDIRSHPCPYCKSFIRFNKETFFARGSITSGIIDTLIDCHFSVYAERNKKIAIWGTKEKADYLMYHSANLRSCVSMVVDTYNLTTDDKGNEIGKVFWGHTVLSPNSLIMEQEVDCILIASVANRARIADVIKNTYKLRAEIIDI